MAHEIPYKNMVNYLHTGQPLSRGGNRPARLFAQVRLTAGLDEAAGEHRSGWIDLARSLPHGVGGGLQIRGHRREDAHLSGTLSLPGRHRRERHPRLRRRPGQLPLSQQQDREAGTAHHVRRAVPVAGVAACAAQGIQACAQLWLSTPQLQALDRLAACAAQVRSGPGSGMGQAARTDSMRLLRCGDDDRANADSVGMLRGHANANCPRGGALTM